MAQDHRACTEGETPRDSQSGVGIHVRCGCIQPGADAKSDGKSGWSLMSKGRSVPARGQSEQTGSELQALICSKRACDGCRRASGIMQVTDFAENRRFSAAC